MLDLARTSRSLFFRTKKILLFYNVSDVESKKKSSVWFRDYPRIKEANTLRGNLARMMSTASSESFRSLYVDIEERCVKLQEMSIKGLSYFQTYVSTSTHCQPFNNVLIG
jgi:hypothetical protein